VSDARLRQLERRWQQTGAQDDEARYLKARIRAGSLQQRRVELAAYLGHEPSRAALVVEDPDLLPSDLFQDGVRVRLESVQPKEGIALFTLDDDLSALARVSVRLDAVSVPLLAAALDEIYFIGVRYLILDLAGVSYVNSTGLSSLARASDALKLAGGRLDVIRVPSKVRIVMEMLGLNAFYKWHPTLEEALKSQIEDRKASQLDALRAIGSEHPLAWMHRLARWGVEPCVRAARTAARSAGEGAEPGRRAPWLHLAGETAARGVWGRSMVALELPPIDEDVVKADLIAWALGRPSPGP